MFHIKFHFYINSTCAQLYIIEINKVQNLAKLTPSSRDKTMCNVFCLFVKGKGGATNLGHPETVPDTSLLSQPRSSSRFPETSTITTTIIYICEHALTGETCQIYQILYSVFQRGYPYRIFEILVVDQRGEEVLSYSLLFLQFNFLLHNFIHSIVTRNFAWK